MSIANQTVTSMELVKAVIAVMLISVSAVVLTHSMQEPYLAPLPNQMVWQLVIPSSLIPILFGMSISAIATAKATRLWRPVWILPFMLLAILVNVEAVAGYLWDVCVHMSKCSCPATL